jgi:hypothetical protein
MRRRAPRPHRTPSTSRGSVVSMLARASTAATLACAGTASALAPKDGSDTAASFTVHGRATITAILASTAAVVRATRRGKVRFARWIVTVEALRRSRPEAARGACATQASLDPGAFRPVRASGRRASCPPAPGTASAERSVRGRRPRQRQTPRTRCGPSATVRRAGPAAPAP